MDVVRDADGWPVEWREVVHGARLVATGSGRRQRVYSFISDLTGRRIWTYSDTPQQWQRRMQWVR